MKTNPSLRPLRCAAFAAVTLTVALGGPHRALAVKAIGDPIDPPDPTETACLSQLSQVRFTATPSTIQSGTWTTLAWSMKVPAGCAGLSLNLGAGPIALPQGSLAVQPLLTSAYALHATYAGLTRLLRTVVVTVTGDLPSTVHIHGPDLRLFQAAIASPNRTVIIDNQVVLDLSGLDDIPIAGGVVIQCGRTPQNPGPLLFTSTMPNKLFEIMGNNVRISGVRIEGAQWDIAENDFSSGIFMDSFTGIEIDHDEIAGWSGSGVKIEDTYDNVQPWANPDTVQGQEH